jgi:hypothetical protein
LRNTQWIYGVVIFAGEDTKLMMNTGTAIKLVLLLFLYWCCSIVQKLVTLTG